MMVTLTLSTRQIDINHQCNMPNDYNNYDTITRAEARRQWVESMFTVLALNKMGGNIQGAIKYITIPSALNNR